MDKVTTAFYDHSTAKRVWTDGVIIKAVRAEHPGQAVSTIPTFSADLLQYAAAGHASAISLDDGLAEAGFTTSNKWREYSKPLSRLDPSTESIKDSIHFGKYRYKWKSHEFILYFVDGRDGATTGLFPLIINQYLVGFDSSIADELILVAGRYTASLHDEIWVFDQGYWQKDPILWQSIQKSRWEDVILAEETKKALRDDVQRFFDAQEQYEILGVPWKRGVIFYGPPGNGKTVSVKATMHMLYSRKEAVPTLYVKTLASYAPPEFSLGEIFKKARQEAPCYLVFEDLDSVVSDRVRSFFLNEVDGLSKNDGILMVGSTNHLELLDPGISKRPSRFDRKYLFPNPSQEMRERYCHYWQGKLKKNKTIVFPDILCKEIAKITHGFSFAYIQEAFVAALLIIASSEDEAIPECENAGDWDFVDGEETVVASDKGGNDDDLDRYVLWVEIKKQIAQLRKDLDTKRANAVGE